MNLEKKHQMLTKHNNFNDLFPHLAYTESESNGILYLLEGAEVGMAWLSNPLAGATERTINSMSQALQLYSWKAGSMVQISLISSSYLEPLFEEHDTIHNNYEESARKMTKARLSHWDLGTKKPIEKFQNTTAKDFYLVISAKMPIKGDLPTDKELFEYEEHFNKVSAALKSAGFSMTCLKPRGLAFIFNMILNPEKVNKQWGESFEYDESKPLREHFLDKGSAVHIHKDHIQINDNFVSVLTIKNYPKQHSIFEMRRLCGDTDHGEKNFTGNFMVTLNIQIFDFEKLEEELSRKKKINQAQAFGPSAKWFPSIGKKKVEFDALFDYLEEGDKPVKSYMVVTLIEKSKKALDEKIQFATTYLKDYLGLSFLADRFFTLPIFLDTFPLSANPRITTELQRYKTMSTSQTVQFAPILADWKGTGTPSLIFFSRSGQIITFDPFDSKLAKNGAIFAESGAGKSFLANAMISTEYCKEKSKIFVIDVGGSYKKLCHVLGGEFIDFDPKDNFILNPFEVVSRGEGEKKEDEAIVINILCSIIEMMCAKVSSSGEIRDPLSAKQSNILGEMITTLYREKKDNSSIDELSHRLYEHPEKDVQEMAYRLYKFTSKSSTGKFFNGKSTVSFSNSKMIVLELKHLEGMGPQVMGVVLFMMMSMIADYSFRSDQSIRKLLIIDEAWGILKNAPDEVVAFLENFYRRIRKSNGAVFIITQSIEDLYESSAGIAIANNSPNKLYLGQTESSVDRAIKKDYVKFTEFQKKLIVSTVNQKPHYSEVFIDAGDLGWGVARLIVDRYHALLYSTEGEEVQAMDNLVELGLTYHESILAYMHQNNWLEGNLKIEFEQLYKKNTLFRNIASRNTASIQ